MTSVEQRPIGSIRPYGKNAKKHPEKQVQQIASSIAEFGFNQPVVVDKDGVIIVGHGRYMAAQLLGLEEVPVVQVNLDEERAKAYRLADNKLNESPWDMDLVIQELREMSMEMLDLTGFDRRLVLDRDDKDDDAPALPEAPRSLQGDLYELGRHRVLCGDATKSYECDLMAGAKADMVFTDPPYNVNYKGSGERTSNGIMNDKMGDEAFLAFLTDAFRNWRETVKGGGRTLRVPFVDHPGRL